MIRRIAGGESGTAMLIVAAVIALTTPIVIGIPGLASTLAIDSRGKTVITRSQYTAIGANDYATYRLFCESGYSDSLTTGVADTYALELNGQQVIVTVVKLSEPPSDPPPPGGDNSRGFRTLKDVIPAVASPFTTTTLNNTVRVENGDDQPENMKKIHDGLPPPDLSASRAHPSASRAKTRTCRPRATTATWPGRTRAAASPARDRPPRSSWALRRTRCVRARRPL